jgi:hypothetical protein
MIKYTHRKPLGSKLLELRKFVTDVKLLTANYQTKVHALRKPYQTNIVCHKAQQLIFIKDIMYYTMDPSMNTNTGGDMCRYTSPYFFNFVQQSWQTS